VTGRSRAAAVVAGSVAALPAASLAEVIERAALQIREDRKYMVPVDRFAELIARLPGAWAVLEIDLRRGFAYESVYFDTSDLLIYRQHVQGRRRRYKVRTRAYLDSGDCAFEVKLKDRREQTVKTRLPYPIADRAHLCPLARAFLADQLQAAYGQPAARLAARVTTTYRRTTLVDLERGTRLTCDVDLVCTGAGRVATGLSGHVLVETKSPGPRSEADAAPRGLGLRPVQMSKYCVAAALLHPGIRANPWYRTLRRYFADAVQGPPIPEP
jgi:VTC domain